MTETEWFEGYGVCPMRKTIAPYWVLVLVIFLLGVLLWNAPVTANPSNHPLMVCYMKLIGTTDEGYTVVAQQCETAEEFRASQK